MPPTTLEQFDALVKNELQRLASLPANWDSEGAYPVAIEIIDAARRLISRLPSGLKSQIPVPAVVPMRKGNLQFEWHKGPKTLELEIESPSTIHYLKWHPEIGVEEEDVCAVADLRFVTALIEWFAEE
jgi:hypothetical protein